jgi:hypothetical protein
MKTACPQARDCLLIAPLLIDRFADDFGAFGAASTFRLARRALVRVDENVPFEESHKSAGYNAFRFAPWPPARDANLNLRKLPILGGHLRIALGEKTLEFSAGRLGHTGCSRRPISIPAPVGIGDTTHIGRRLGLGRGTLLDGNQSLAGQSRVGVKCFRFAGRTGCVCRPTR